MFLPDVNKGSAWNFFQIMQSPFVFWNGIASQLKFNWRQHSRACKKYISIIVFKCSAHVPKTIFRKIKDLKRAEELVKAQYQEPDNAVSISAFPEIEFYSNYSEKNLMYDDGCRFEKPSFSIGNPITSFLRIVSVRDV